VDVSSSTVVEDQSAALVAASRTASVVVMGPGDSAGSAASCWGPPRPRWQVTPSVRSWWSPTHGGPATRSPRTRGQ
jgi:hypothetical protein